MSAMFNVPLPISSEYENLVRDLVKAFTILLVLHLIGVYSNNSAMCGILGKEVFDGSFVNILVYSLLSVLAYHLVVKKLVSFELTA